MNILSIYVVLSGVLRGILVLSDSLKDQLLRSEKEFTDYEFALLIETYPGNKTAFTNNLISRNFPLSKLLMNDINKHFGNSMLATLFHQIPRHQSVDSIDTATLFCCECLTFRINCPICKISDMFGCEYPLFEYSEQHISWYKIFNHYYHRFSVQPKDTFLKNTLMIVPSIVKGFSFFSRVVPPSNVCSTPNVVRTIYSPEEGITNCTVVVPKSVPCPMANFKPDHQCDWSSTLHENVSHLKVCFSRRLKPGAFRFIDSVNEYVCNKKYYFRFPAATEIIRGMISDSYTTLPYRVMGYSSDSVYFSSYNNTLLNKVVNDLQISSKLSPATPILSTTVKRKIICDHNHAVRKQKAVYNGEDSWLGDIFIPAPSEIVIYNLTHAIYYNYLYSPYLSCNPFVKYVRHSIIKSVKATPNMFGTYVNASVCASLADVSSCAFHSLFNSTFSNMTYLLNVNDDRNFRILSDALRDIHVNVDTDFAGFEKFLHKEYIDLTARFRNILNKTFDNYLNNLLDALSKNGTYEYKCSQGFCYTKLGGWLSDIFAALIEPFFNVFLSLVVRPIFKILLESFIDIVKISSDLLQKLGNELGVVLDDLAEAVTVLLTTLLNLIVKLYKFLEARILLSEYIALFLFLIYFIKNNSVFSIVIVVIVLVIFGFERKTQPSILLTLID